MACPRHRSWVALVLSLGAAVSLGITRFAYGLLLPPMRADLGWSYTLAGSMNTSNAFGYFIGALMAPALLRRFGAGSVLVIGSLLASVFMALSGFFTDSVWLFRSTRIGWHCECARVCLRRCACREARCDESRKRGGLLLGIYYGGTSIGIVLPAFLVPALLAYAANALAGLCGLGVGMVGAGVRVRVRERARVASTRDATADERSGQQQRTGSQLSGVGVCVFACGYAMLVGYIGYMTFV